MDTGTVTISTAPRVPTCKSRLNAILSKTKCVISRGIPLTGWGVSQGGTGGQGVREGEWGEGCRHYVVIFLRARFIVAARDKFVIAPCTPPAAGNYCMNCNLSMMASLNCDASSTSHSYLGKVSTKIFNKVIIL